MYVRFVIPEKHRDSGRRMGIFQAAYYLKYTGDLQPYELTCLTDVMDWFDWNLRAPVYRARLRRHHPFARSICWYKSDAEAHIARMWDIVAILEQHHRRVTLIRTTRPGYVVYEDHYQVAAEPFCDTGA